MQKLSIIIPTRNEARNIADCLRSVMWADEIVVVDDFSTDATAAIARHLGARVVAHQFASPAAQKNWALQQATHPWALSVDADERVTPQLRREIERILAADGPADGYLIPRRSYFLGRWMRYGPWRHDRPLRLFRRDRIHYPERAVHEAAEVQGRIGLCRGMILHYSYRSLEDCVVKMRRYAEWGAREWQRRGRRPSLAGLALHGPLRFVRDYVLQLGFAEGWRGLLLCLFEAWHVTVKEMRLWELARPGARAAFPAGCAGEEP